MVAITTVGCRLFQLRRKGEANERELDGYTDKGNDQ